MGRECKILIIELFNSLVIVQSLHEVLGCNKYVNTQQEKQVDLSIDRPSQLSTEL